MASRNRRHSLFSRRAVSCLAGPPLSQCDLARFRADRRKLPLFGAPRLLAMGITGMARRSVVPQKKKRGAPGKGELALRLAPGLLARVDRWAASQKDAPSRPEAIRRLVELGLAIAPRAEVRPEKAAKAAEMASQEIDRLGDPSATDE